MSVKTYEILYKAWVVQVALVEAPNPEAALMTARRDLPFSDQVNGLTVDYDSFTVGDSSVEIDDSTN